MKTSSRIGVLFAATLFVGCSGSDLASQPLPSPTTNESTIVSRSTVPIESTLPSTAPTTEAATTTTIDRRTVAADRYIELVTPLNCSAQILTSVEEGVMGPDSLFYPEDWPQIQQALQPVYANYAQELIVVISGLIAFTDWPDDMQPNIDALVNELAANASFYDTLANASSYDSWGSQMWESPNPPQNSAASVVRAKLGLETNVGSTRDFCTDLAETVFQP